MWFSLIKLEFKKGLFYYLILYLFFFFWAPFTLFNLYFYKNFSKLSNEFSAKRGLTLAYYPETKTNKISELEEFFKKFKYVKKISISSPIEVYRQVKDTPPFKGFTESEVLKYFPYVIKIELDLERLEDLKKELINFKKFSPINLEILSEPYPTLLGFTQWKYFNFSLFLLLLFGHLFYFLFFYFLNINLSNYTKDQIEIFQLLGGHILSLKLIRLLLILLPLIIIFSLSFVLYYLIALKLNFYFPLFKIYPNMDEPIDLLYFVLDFAFLLFLYPFIVLFYSLKKV